MRYVVQEEEWRTKCIAVGQHPSSIPDSLTDILIGKILRAKLKERVEFPDRKIEGLYLRAGVDRQQGTDTVPGPRTWRLRGRVRSTGERFHYQIGDARKGMSVEQARDRASIELGKLAAGLNPGVMAKADAAQMQTVGHYLESTYAPGVLSRLKDGRKMKARMLSVWAPLLDVPLVRLTPDTINAVLVDRKDRDNIRGGTMNRLWGQLRHMLSDANEREILPADLARKLMRMPKVLVLDKCRDAKHIRWLGKLDPGEPARFEAALAAFTSDKPGGGEFLRCAVRIALETGMRRGEMLRVTDSMVKRHPDRIELPKAITKADKDHTVYLTPAAVQAIARWRDVRKTLAVQTIDGHLFPGDPTQWEHRLTDHHDDFQRMRREAAIDERCTCCERILHWHDLRHTFAVRLYKSCGSLTKVRDALGHATTAQAEQYAHEVDDAVRSAVLAM